jgi:hypothetical protein
VALVLRRPLLGHPPRSHAARHLAGVPPTCTRLE